MPEIRRAALVRRSPHEMYELVNDVESYPQFLPWCHEARVLERDEDFMVARILVARAGIEKAFTTRNTLVPDRAIHLDLVDGPFRRLHGEWRFSPHARGLCSVEFSLAFEYSSRLVAMTLGPLFDRIADSLVDAFCRQAELGPR